MRIGAPGEKDGSSAYGSAFALLPRGWVNSSRSLLGQFLTLAGNGAGVGAVAGSNAVGGGIYFATSGLEKQLAAHEQRLVNYKSDVDAHDNKGHLKKAGNDQKIRQKIIDGRIKKLENQIKNFRRLIARLKELKP